MSKKFYLEIGTTCFTRCISCNVSTALKESDIMPFKDICKIIDILISKGYTEVRFTGRDPLSYKQFSKLTNMIHYANIHKVVNTTLSCRSLDKIYSCTLYDEVIVSLSSIKENYNKFFGVNKFHIVDKNLHVLLAMTAGKVTINYVVNEKDKNLHELYEFCKYIESLTDHEKIRLMFFPEIRLNPHEHWNMKDIEIIDENMEHTCERLISRGFFVQWLDDYYGKKIRKCKAMPDRLYIKYDGDVYPCCNAGGELGNRIYGDTYLGNIFSDNIDDILSKTERDVNNPVCDRCTPKYSKFME